MHWGSRLDIITTHRMDSVIHLHTMDSSAISTTSTIKRTVRYSVHDVSTHSLSLSSNAHSVQCAHGSPLTNGNGAPQRCQRDGDCPTTHTCATEHAVCCPTPRKNNSVCVYSIDCRDVVYGTIEGGRLQTISPTVLVQCRGANM